MFELAEVRDPFLGCAGRSSSSAGTRPSSTGCEPGERVPYLASSNIRVDGAREHNLKNLSISVRGIAWW